VREAIAKGLAADPVSRLRGAAELSRALEPEGADVSPLLRRVALAGAAIVALGTAAVAVDAARRRLTTPALNENLLAVAPLDVLHPGATEWRNGMVVVLSRTLDGFGRLRTVAPTVAIRRWDGSGRADREGAMELGRRTRARLVLVGTLVAAGPTGARLSAALFDAASGATLGEYEARGEVLQIAALADTLTLGVLRDLGATGRVGAVRRREATLGAHHMPALKAFFQAEEYYRNNQLLAAQAAAERAVQLDPRFALPHHRLRTILRATRAENDSLSLAHAAHADSLNTGLSLRDSLLVAAGGYYAAASRLAQLTPAWWALTERRFAALERLVTEYPNDPEAWYELGEARQHDGARLGVTHEQALEAFEKAIAIDSAFAPAFYHAVELRATVRAVASARALALRYPVPPDGSAPDSVDRQRRAAMALAARLLRQSRGERSACADLDASVPLDAVLAAAYALRRVPDAAAAAFGCYRALRERGSRLERAAADRVRNTEAAILLYRGRGREALAASDSTLTSTRAVYFQHLALLGDVPADSASAVFAAWRDSGDPWLGVLALPWFAARRDDAGVRALVRSFDAAAARTAISARDSGLAAYGAAAGRGYLTLLAGDIAGALDRFARVPDSLCGWWCTPDRLLRAHLLADRGAVAPAARLLDRWPPPPDALFVTEVLWRLVRARVAELAGDRARAERGYAFASAVFADAEPRLRDCVQSRRGRAGRVPNGSDLPSGAALLALACAP
jgi:serine/threonine-protein kinase